MQSPGYNSGWKRDIGEIFADNDKTAAYLNSCYEGLPAKALTYNWVQNAPTCLSDEAWLTFKSELRGVADQLYDGTGSANLHPLRDDGNYYAKYLYPENCPYSKKSTCQALTGANRTARSGRSSLHSPKLCLQGYRCNYIYYTTFSIIYNCLYYEQIVTFLFASYTTVRC